MAVSLARTGPLIRCPAIPVNRKTPVKSFLWIGQELPFRWIAVQWREGNFFSKEDALEYAQDFPQNYFESIRYNPDYLKIDFEDFNSESAYRIYGLWESIEGAKGGPFEGYLFYDCLLYTSPSPRD